MESADKRIVTTLPDGTEVDCGYNPRFRYVQVHHLRDIDAVVICYFNDLAHVPVVGTHEFRASVPIEHSR